MNIETLKKDVYNKPFEYIWWYYDFYELMAYAKTVGLKVDENIVKSQSNRELARFIKEKST